MYSSKGFDFLPIKDTFTLTVTQFLKNDANPFTEGLPYALLIGTTNNTKLPRIISVLAIRDNNIYTAGDTLTIIPVDNPLENNTLRPIYFTKDTIIDKEKYRTIIGAEYSAVWGRVFK